MTYRGGESSQRAIEVTKRLTTAEQIQVPIITMAHSGADGTAIARETQQLMGANAAGAKFLPPIPPQLEYLQSYIERLPPGMIILGADCPLLQRISPEALSDRLARPVLVIR